jgi:hypothetical protein
MREMSDGIQMSPRRTSAYTKSRWPRLLDSLPIRLLGAGCSIEGELVERYGQLQRLRWNKVVPWAEALPCRHRRSLSAADARSSCALSRRSPNIHERHVKHKAAI